MPSPKEVPKRQMLQSWKAIAAFLGVTVRSVQRWEGAGLPVHRQGPGSKARVFAYTDELAQWLESSAVRTVEPEVASSPKGRRWVVWAGAVAAVLLAASGVFLWRAGVLPGSRVPHAWVWSGTRLTILDARGRVCWEKSLPREGPAETSVRDKAVIADIDGDGRTEVLLNFVPEDLQEKGGSLLCFEQNGKLRWEIRHGGPKSFAGRTFEPTYAGRLLLPVRIGGQPRVISVANHSLWYPSQVALLDPRSGRVVEEYWHPGWIYYAALRDVDGDGQVEMLFGAINNPGEGLGHAAVGILKLPFSKSPKRPAEPPFQGITGGGELAYALLPLPDISRVQGLLPIMAAFNVDAQRRIRVETPIPEGGIVVHYLDFNLGVLECRPSDNFAAVHERFFRQHLLDHHLSADESASLGKAALFAAAPDGNSPDVARLFTY